MKHVLPFLFTALLIGSVCLLSACAPASDDPADASMPDGTQPGDPVGSDPAVTGPNDTVSAESAALPETAPVTEEETKPSKPAPAPGSLKVLAVGNSFSVDAMEYVYRIAQDLGYTDIVLGNLYIGGCPIETHVRNIRGNKAAYTLYTNTDGTWSQTQDATVDDGIAFADWDYITVQQASGSSGQPSTYRLLGELVESLAAKAPDARILWHMTWAYQSDCTHADFPKYHRDQMEMYESILSCYEDKVVPLELDGMIPDGTAIQNMRTSYLGDHLTRDGYHMDQGIGRYILGMMWVKAITGADIDAVTWTPPAAGIHPVLLAAVKEAVNNAYATPLGVTPSTYNEQPGADDLLRAMGKSRDEYEVLDLDVLSNSFYNSAAATNAKRISKQAGYVNDLLEEFAATRIFTRDELPVGSIILLKDGYQYRPEGWITKETVNAGVDRPTNTTASFVIVTDEWWGDYTMRAFNLSVVGAPMLNEAQMAELCGAMEILVPIADQ